MYAAPHIVPFWVSVEKADFTLEIDISFVQEVPEPAGDAHVT